MKLKHFFLGYFILFTIVLLTVVLNQVSDVASGKSVCLQSHITEFPINDFGLKQNKSNSPKHCEIVETPVIPIPVSLQLKNKYSDRFKQQVIIYLRRENSLLSINNRVISVTKNFSLLSDILQI